MKLRIREKQQMMMLIQKIKQNHSFSFNREIIKVLFFSMLLSVRKPTRILYTHQIPYLVNLDYMQKKNKNKKLELTDTKTERANNNNKQTPLNVLVKY